MKIYAFADEASSSMDGQIRAMKRNRMNGLEIRGTDSGNVSRIAVKDAREIAEKLRDNGLSVWAVGSPVGKIHIVNDDFGAHMDLFRHTLEVADALECKNIRMFSFYLPEGSDPALYRSEVIDRLSLMTEEAAAAGILLCHENEKGIYGDKAVRCADLLDTIPGLKCVFDPANFIQCGQEIDEAWKLLGSRTYYMHIKDALPDGSVVPAGKGSGLLPEILKDYKAMGGEHLTLEPHLRVFEGLKDLERDQKTEIPDYAYASSDEAFDAAASALYSILETL